MSHHHNTGQQLQPNHTTAHRRTAKQHRNSDEARKNSARAAARYRNGGAEGCAIQVCWEGEA
jgi:hypothetical protein